MRGEKAADGLEAIEFVDGAVVGVVGVSLVTE